MTVVEALDILRTINLNDVIDALITIGIMDEDTFVDDPYNHTSEYSFIGYDYSSQKDDTTIVYDVEHSFTGYSERM